MTYEINGLPLVVYHREGGIDAIGYLTTAERYLVAAEKLVHQGDFLPAVGDPESFLTGHSFELLLKSFLLARGISAEDLANRNKFSHDLGKCLSTAKEEGLTIAPVSRSLETAVGIICNEYLGKGLE